VGLARGGHGCGGPRRVAWPGVVGEGVEGEERGEMVRVGEGEW